MDIFIPWHCVVVTCRLSLSPGGGDIMNILYCCTTAASDCSTVRCAAPDSGQRCHSEVETDHVPR